MTRAHIQPTAGSKAAPRRAERQPGATAAVPPGTGWERLQLMAEAMPAVARQRALQSLADGAAAPDRHRALQRMADRQAARSGASPQPLQRAVGHAGLDAIKATIFKGTASAAPIAEGLYAYDGPTDGDFTSDTANKIKQTARDFGYPDEHATRLAEKRPFTKADIQANTGWVRDADEDAHPRQVESFEFSSEISDHDPATVSRHQLDFENIFSATGRVTFKYNARNPALANFFASDVVEEQRAFIEAVPGLAGTGGAKSVVREDVQSVNGREWWERHGRKRGDLTADELRDFLENTDNGKSTVTMFRGQYSVVRGRVLPYDNDADRFSVRLWLGPYVA